MVEMSWFIVVSLAVASFTLSHVMATFPSAEEADRAISVSVTGFGGDSGQRILDRMSCAFSVNGKGMLVSW